MAANQACTGAGAPGARSGRRIAPSGAPKCPCGPSTAFTVLFAFLLASCELAINTNGLTDAAVSAEGGAEDAPTEPQIDSTSPDASSDATTDAPDAPVDARNESPPDGPGAAGDEPAQGNISIVARQVNAVSSTEQATATLPLGPVTAGDAIVTVVHFDSRGGATFQGVADGLGSVFVPVVGPLLGDDSTTYYIVLALDTAPGADALTVTLSVPAPYIELYAVEYAGLATSNAFDTSSVTIGTSGAVDGMSSGIATTSSPHELIFGVGATGYCEGGTGFAVRSGYDGNVVEDEVVTAKGSYEATATMTAGSSWTMLVATFRGQSQ